MRTALVVDTYAPLRKHLRRFLSSTKRFTMIAEASSGRDAFAKVRELKPDTVFISLDLPDVGGLDVAKAVVRANPKCKVIVIGSDGEEYHKAAEQAGAVTFVTREELFQRLSDLVEGNGHQPNGAGVSKGNGLRGRVGRVLRHIWKDTTSGIGAGNGLVCPARSRQLVRATAHVTAALWLLMLGTSLLHSLG